MPDLSLNSLERSATDRELVKRPSYWPAQQFVLREDVERIHY